MSDHDQKFEQEILDKGLTAPRVTFDSIQALMNRVVYVSHVPAGTTSTFVHAFLDGKFFLATGYTACVSLENFDAALGEKYAKDKAVTAARDKLWELEGYALFKSMGA